MVMVTQTKNHTVHHDKKRTKNQCVEKKRSAWHCDSRAWTATSATSARTTRAARRIAGRSLVQEKMRVLGCTCLHKLPRRGLKKDEQDSRQRLSVLAKCNKTRSRNLRRQPCHTSCENHWVEPDVLTTALRSLGLCLEESAALPACFQSGIPLSQSACTWESSRRMCMKSCGVAWFVDTL
jgi:hypothetical protein